MIKQATRTNPKISILILNAIHNLANMLTGEEEKEKILKTQFHFLSKSNHNVPNKYKALKV